MAAEWREASLDDLVEIRHGFAFQGEFFHEEPPGDLLLTPGNFAIGGGFKSDKVKYFRGPTPKEFVLAAGDLLVTMTDLSKGGDTLGYPALVPQSGGADRYLHNQRLGKVVIKPGAPLEKRFLYYVLCGREYRNEVIASATRPKLAADRPITRAEVPSNASAPSLTRIRRFSLLAEDQAVPMSFIVPIFKSNCPI